MKKEFPIFSPLYETLCCFLVVGVLSIGISPRSSLAATRTEYQVKAAFLYHFSQFVEWPSESYASTNGRIHVCVVGQDPFGMVLEKTFSTKTVNNHQFFVLHDVALTKIQDCHVLFIGLLPRDKTNQLQKALEDSHVLTVGETEDFIDQGGMVRFYFSGSKVRFAVNPDEVKRHKLKISSKLLRLAKIERPE